MLGYFSTRPVIEWRTPRFGDAGKGVLDGVLPLAQQVELQQRAEAMAIYRYNEGRGEGGVRLDPVLRAHLGLEQCDR